MNDEHIVHPQSGKGGLHLVVSANPKSANSDPKTFNTLRALLVLFYEPLFAGLADEPSLANLTGGRRTLSDDERSMTGVCGRAACGTGSAGAAGDV